MEKDHSNDNPNSSDHRLRNHRNRIKQSPSADFEKVDHLSLVRVLADPLDQHHFCRIYFFSSLFFDIWINFMDSGEIG